MPRLNSVMLCPKARANDGSRLDPNNSSTIATIRMIFQVKPTLLCRAMAKQITRRPARTYHQFYKMAAGRQTRQRKLDAPPSCDFSGKSASETPATDRSEDFAAMTGGYR
jgi:hypothetical protein